MEKLDKKFRWKIAPLTIATNSPFLLSVENATVYDLDRCPSTVCNWYELKNLRAYYDFLKMIKIFCVKIFVFEKKHYLCD